MTVSGDIEVRRQLKKNRPHVTIGASTVQDAETARTCIPKGAQFSVSLALNLRTVELCQRYSVPVLPGALTPTEIVTEWQTGGDIVKVFLRERWAVPITFDLLRLRSLRER